MRIIVDVQDLQPGRASSDTVASYVRSAASNIDQEIALRAGAAGAFAVVGKPINLDALKVLAALAMSLA